MHKTAKTIKKTGCFLSLTLKNRILHPLSAARPCIFARHKQTSRTYIYRAVTMAAAMIAQTPRWMRGQ